MPKRLRDIRRSRHISQRTIARLLGISSQTVSSIELGETPPSLRVLCRYTEIFGIGLDQLVFGIRDEVPGLSERDLELISRFHDMDPRMQRQLYETVCRKSKEVIIL